MCTKKQIEIVWHIDDVKSRLEEYNHVTGCDEKLSDEECYDILVTCKKYHDADYGINWNTIDYAIEKFIEERK